MNIRTYKKNGSLFSYYYCPKMAREGVSACDTGYTRVDDIDDRFLQELKKIKLSPDSIELEENVSYVDTGKMRAESEKGKRLHPESDERTLRQCRFFRGKVYYY